MPTRVLIADDMQTTYLLLRSILEQGGDFEVVGWAKEGKEVVRLTNKLAPDIVTMDIEMPEQSGLEAIREIMSSTPVPIVVVSSHVNDVRMNLAFTALREGALDVMGKPPALNDPSFPHYAETLATKLHALAEVKVIRRRAVTKKEKVSPSALATPDGQQGIELVALGASAGGPQALSSILAQLPQNYPYPIVIVQHIIEGFMDGMASWLDMLCSLRVKVAEDNESLLPGTVYFSPDCRHLTIRRNSNQKLVAVLDDSPPLGGFKPSINRLMESVAAACGRHAIGGILTGMGSDGAAGLRTLAQSGALTFAQDEETSLIYGMPKVAVESGATKQTLALPKIAGFLCDQLPT